MSQVLKNGVLVLVFCLLSILGQIAWLMAIFSDSLIGDSLIVLLLLIAAGLVFCLFIGFFSRLFTDRAQPTPSWLKSMTNVLAYKLVIAEPEIHILNTTGLNAFAIDNLTRNGHIFLHQQVPGSLTHDEVEAILAHEMCHIEKGHAGVLSFIQGMMLPVSLPFSVLFSFLFCLYTGFDKFRTNLLTANGFLSLVCFPVASVVLFIFNRYWEYDADACAASLVGKEQYLQALRCLHGSFFQHPNLLGAMGGISNNAAEKGRRKKKSQGGGLSHPSLAQRINALQEIGP